MTDLLKQDIFFFVTTIFVVLLSIISLIVAYFILRILKNIRSISETAKNETNAIAQDLSDLRENVKSEGVKLKHLSKFFSSIYKRTK